MHRCLNGDLWTFIMHRDSHIVKCERERRGELSHYQVLYGNKIGYRLYEKE